MPGHDTRAPSDQPTVRRRYRVAALFGALGLLATVVAIGPASANGDDERTDPAPAAALRSTGAESTADEATDRPDPASIAATESASTTRSTGTTAAGLREVDGERLAITLRGLTDQLAAEGTIGTKPSSTEAAAATSNPATAATQAAETTSTATDTTPATKTPATETQSQATGTTDTKPAAKKSVATKPGDQNKGSAEKKASAKKPADKKPAAKKPDSKTKPEGTIKGGTDKKPATKKPTKRPGIDGVKPAGIVADDMGDTTNEGPDGGVRFFTGTVGGPALEIPGREGVTDPEGDPFDLVGAVIFIGEGSLEFDGDLLIYTPPSGPGPDFYTEIEITYVDSKGAVGSGLVVIESELPVEPVCEEVELFTDELLVNREEGSTAFVIPETMLGCEFYELELISTDERHEPGYQTNQTAESWFVEGIRLSYGKDEEVHTYDQDEEVHTYDQDKDAYSSDQDEVVYTSPVTPDLPDDQTTATVHLPAINPYQLGIEAWQIRHVGEGGVNSVRATLRLIPSGPPPPPGCEPIAVFEFVRLLNRDGERTASVPFTPPTCPFPATVVLASTDAGHQPGHQPEQDEEYWTLVAYDADGEFLFSLEGPDDLPDDLIGDVVYYDEVDLTDVAEFHIVHDAFGDNINSVEASVIIYFEHLP